MSGEITECVNMYYLGSNRGSNLVFSSQILNSY